MALRRQKTYNPYTSSSSKYQGNVVIKEQYSILRVLVHEVSYGGFRRKKILELLKSGIEYPVNGEHGIQVKKDPDLKRLLKEDKIEMITEGGKNFKRTYVRYKNG